MSIGNHDIVLLTVAYHSHQALVDLAGDLVEQKLQPKKWLVVNNSPLSVPPIQLEAQCNISLISGKEGEGFGQGCNRGLDYLQNQGWCGWVWLLNPDTELPDKETICRLSMELSLLPSNALVGTAVTDIKGNLEKSAGWIDPGLDFRRRRVDEFMTSNDQIKPVVVDWLSGCSLIMQPAAHQNQPRFESWLPLYYEDMDLCLRLSKSGVPIFWLPSIRIGHRRGHGSKTSLTRRIRLSSCSYIRFLQRHRPGWVLFLRSFRLLANSLLRLPLNPSRSFAVLHGWLEACRKPLS